MSTPDGIMSTDINNSLVHKIKKNLSLSHGDSMAAKKYTIFRVPAHIRQKNKELYEPRMVSIGPYYNGYTSLHAMEKNKWVYLQDYLSRNPRNSVEHCISELRGLEFEARRCYFDKVKLKSDKFLMMMLLDGCFIIEFLIKCYSGVTDTILNVRWALPIIRSDLLLLENQIPFFVIQKLYGLLNYSGPLPAEENAPVVPRIATPLVEMLLEYLSEKKRHVNVVFFEIKHILHLYHFCYMPELRPNTKSADERFPRTIPSATELKEAGITFKSKKSENIFDIKFENGTLEIPFISIEETRRSRLLNLVFFEQCDGELNMNLTSYACFMGGLFKDSRDVTLLQKKGIVDNLLATNDELVSFFNWLTECSYLDYDRHYLRELFRDVNMYYNSYWHRSKATLKRDYFGNPWSIISFAAAFALLVLTVLQTLYTILSYYYRKN